MKYNSYSDIIWQKIESTIQEVSRTQSHPVAAFDADGTLWDTDLGENFFKYQIHHKLLASLPEDPWKHYRTWKASGDPRPAYLWLAQINKGVSLSQVQQWAEEAVQELSPLPTFSDQKKLIDILHHHKVEVFVVTASVKWAVEPGALRLNIDHEHVIGVDTRISDGLVTDIQNTTMTYREGKLQALLEKTNGRIPFFCCGNTLGDIGLLKGASHLSLAVGAAKPEDELWTAEESLREEALKQNWLIHKF